MPLIFKQTRKIRPQRSPLHKAEDPILTPANAGLTQVERAFVYLFAAAMAELRRALPPSLAALLSKFDTKAIVTVAEVDRVIESVIQEMRWTTTMDKLRVDTSEIFEDRVVRGGKVTANVPKQIVAQFGFDSSDFRAVAWAEAQAGALVKEIDEETRNAIKKIVLDSLNGNYSGDDAAEMISRVIGLNTRQTRAVENMYQKTLANLVEDGTPKRTAIKMARERSEQYRVRLIEQRGQMIARTEIMRASNNGRLLSWAQAFDDGLITSAWRKEWRTYPGFGATGPCPECLELRGTTVEVFKEFPNGVLMPPAHPYCRCTSILVPPDRGIPSLAPVGSGYASEDIDPIGGALSEVITDSVLKANPYRDRASGRFTYGPGGRGGDTGGAGRRGGGAGRNNTRYEHPNAGHIGENPLIESRHEIEILDVTGTGDQAAKEYLDSATNGFSFYGTDADGVRLNPPGSPLDPSKPHTFGDIEEVWNNGFISRSPANGRAIKSDYEGHWHLKGNSATARVSREMMGGEAAGAFNPRDSETATALLASVHSGKAQQPTLWRGMTSGLSGRAGGSDAEPGVGDVMSLPLSSFSHSAVSASMFMNRPGTQIGEINDGSSIVRLRRGSKGHSIRQSLTNDEMEVVTAGRYRVTGTAKVQLTRIDGKISTIRVYDIEHIETWDLNGGEFIPVMVEKAKFKDFGFSLSAYFMGRMGGIDGVEKANPYRDRSSGRFTFGPANDMGGGSAAGGISNEELAARERFKSTAASMRAEINEELGDPDEFFGEGDPPGVTRHELLKTIEFGHVVRTEIDRRDQAELASTSYRDKAKKLGDEKAQKQLVYDRERQDAFMAARDYAAASKSHKVLSDEVRSHEGMARLEARQTELSNQRSRNAQDFQNTQSRLRTEYAVANPPRSGESFTDVQARTLAHLDSHPDIIAVRERGAQIDADLRTGRELLYEAKFEGKIRSDIYGPDVMNPRGRVTMRPDHPLRSDPDFMAKRTRLTESQKNLDSLGDISVGARKRSDAAMKDLMDTNSAIVNHRSDARRRAIKSTLEDAGVTFSPGKVVLTGDGPDAVAKALQDGNIVMRGQRRSKAVRSVEEAAPFLPRSWAQGASSAAVDRRGGMEIKFDKNRRGEFGDYKILTDGRNTSLHELVHSVEASNPRLVRFERAFYEYRTRGESAQSLRALNPGSRYKAHEVTRPDKFYSSYVGKDYDGRFYELATMSFADTVFPRGNKNPFEELDPELQAWLWATVILA
jgi:hypothetical protein